MIHIPILRQGVSYESVEKADILHHATGEAVARLSQANSGLIGRDARRMRDDVLERFTTGELLAICRRAAELFSAATLPLGDGAQTFDNYLRHLSATTGMPIVYCRNNAFKIRQVLAEMEAILGGLTRGLDHSVLDRGFGLQRGSTVSFFREGRVLGAVLPSNSPGVHSLWIPAFALKTPLVLKPGREEPWTPYRVIQALIAAGAPREAFGFYPTDHAGAAEIIRTTHRSMLFGDASTTRPWTKDSRVQLHGPGFSKVLLGDDAVEVWPQYVDVIVSSIEANGGRSCLNTSAVWVPRRGRDLAEALAQRLAVARARPADDPDATLAAFANPTMAERISAAIDQDLLEPGAADLTERHRGSPRLARLGRCAYLLPTIIHCERSDHPLANREFLFPFASVIECPTSDMPEAIGPTLVATVITQDQPFLGKLTACANVDRLNVGPIPTWRLSWDQPHEGNLFTHLYRQRAFQIETAA